MLLLFLDDVLFQLGMMMYCSGKYRSDECEAISG
jgi:hypothetical protein